MILQLVLLCFVSYTHGLMPLKPIWLNRPETERTLCGATHAYLRALVRYGAMPQKTMDEVRTAAEKSLRDAPDSLLQAMSNWDALTEFIELEISKKKKYGKPIFVLKRLTPVIYWDILKGVPFPKSIWGRNKKKAFRTQKRAVVKILEQVCGKKSLEKAVRINRASIQKVFAVLVLNGSSGELARKVAVVKQQFTNFEWDRIAKDLINLPDFRTKPADVTLHEGIRPFTKELREIATDLGVYGCVPFASSAIVLQPTMSKLAYDIPMAEAAPRILVAEPEEAPVLSIQGAIAAPDFP